MTNHFKKTFFFIGLIALTFTFFIQPSHADIFEEQLFMVVPIYPENQDTDITQHISVSTDEDSFRQEFDYELKNNTDKPLNILIKPLNALTSPNGVIQYTVEDSTENSILIDEAYSLSDYIGVIDNITIEPKARQRIRFLVDIPKTTDIEGTILGAIGFQVTEEGDVQEQDDIQFQIDNETSVTMGVQINFDTDRDADFEVHDPYVDKMPSYYAIRLPVTLHAPLIMRDIVLDYEVFDRNERLLFDNKREEFKFAPNTKANIRIPWEYESIEKGKMYRIKGELRYDDEIIPFDKTFKFEDDKVSSPNGPDLGIPNIESNWLLWLLGLLAILLALIGYLIYRNRNRYVLYADSLSIVEVIDKDHELFDKVLPKHKAIYKNEPYMLIYKPHKETINTDDVKSKGKLEIVRYTYVNMKKLKVQSVEPVKTDEPK